MTAAAILTGYGLALGFRCADALRIQAALYRLRRIDRLINERKWREARRTFAAVSSRSLRQSAANSTPCRIWPEPSARRFGAEMFPPWK